MQGRRPWIYLEVEFAYCDEGGGGGIISSYAWGGSVLTGNALSEAIRIRDGKINFLSIWGPVQVHDL
jgi:hypothetical protein